MEDEALEIAEKMTVETTFLKRKKLQFALENRIHAMLVHTRSFCISTKALAKIPSFGYTLQEVQRAYYPEDYYTIKDCGDNYFLMEKLTILEALNQTPDEKSITGSGDIS
jgi:hypothetical protein